MFMDIHTHAFHPKIAKKVVAQLGNHYGIKITGSGLIEDLLARAKRAGISKVAVHSAATSQAQVVPANDFAISLQEGHPEVVGFGTLHPDFTDFEPELARLEQAGIKGLKFHPDFQGFWLNDPRLEPILECVGTRFVLMFHVGDRLPPDENPSCPRKLAALHRKFPRAKMIAAHFGGYQHWKWALEHLIGQDIFVDTSSSLDFIDQDILRQIVRKHPREKILFGSDYPLFDPGAEIANLQQRLKLSDQELEEILSSAAGLFAQAKQG